MRLEKDHNRISAEFGEKFKNIEEKVNSLNKEILEKDLNKDFDKELHEIKQQFQKLQKREDKKLELENQLKDLKDLSALIERFNIEIKDMKTKLTEQQQISAELKKDYDKYKEANSEYIEVNNNLSKISEQRASIKTNINNLKGRIENAKKYEEEIKEIKKNLEDIKKEQEIYSEFKKNIFHQNGVPMFAMKKILPAIQIKASEILIDLTDGKLNHIVFREFETANRVGFDIYVHDGEQEREATSFSGGEKTQINAAIRFAIMEKIAEIPDTAGAVFRKSNTLFIDEGDLGTLDDDVARKRFIDKILELEKMFKKIILITHLEDVAEQFPNRIKVGRDEHGKSKIYN